MADQIFTIPKGWKMTTLGEVARIKHGFAFSGENITSIKNRNVLLTPGNFLIGGGWKDGKKYFNGEVPADYILHKGDLIVTMTDLSKKGDTLGSPALVPDTKNRYLHNQRVGLVMVDEKKVSKDYLYFLMRLPEYQRFIVNASTGSTVKHTSPTRIESFGFAMPSLPSEQCAIATVLSSLDSKIELLREQSKTLEAAAQAIFKEWFVNFNFPGATGKMTNSELGRIPEGWRKGNLEEEMKITMGQSPAGESYNLNNDGAIFFQGRTDFGERFPQIRLYTTEPKRMAKKFDVLVSVRAPVGDINLASEDCCIGRGLAAVSSEYKSYALYKIQSLKDIFNKFEAEGTIFGSINKDSFSAISVLIPQIEVVEDFDKMVQPIDKKIFNSYIQIQTLSALRDELLPKLMKGIIRVKF